MRRWILIALAISTLGASGSVRTKCCTGGVKPMEALTCATPVPTPTASPTIPAGACAFHTACDGSALTSVNDSSNGGTYAWVNPAAAKIIDTSNAGGTNLTQNALSQYLKVTDFAGSTANNASISCVGGVTHPGVTAIPDDAVILGLYIQISGCEVGSFDPPYIEDTEMRLIVNGVFGTANRALVGGWSPTYNCVNGSPYRYYGSASDLWGFTSISGADLKTSSFGVALSVTARGGDVAPSVDGFAFNQICYKLVGE